MAKQTNRNSGPWTQEGLDQLIDSWVELIGEPPAGSFEIGEYKNGELVTYRGTAREKLRSEIATAFYVYRVGDGRGILARWQGQLTQLQLIQEGAHRLLVLVGKSSFEQSRLGISEIIVEEETQLRAALKKVLSPEQIGRFGLRSSRHRLEEAIDGVESLHRWTKTAAEMKQQQIARKRGEMGESGSARHKGDVGLNGYIEWVVNNCWQEVWGRPISDGRKLWNFVTMAAAAVDVRLSDVASRERIRRIFGLRRANQSDRSPDLPIVVKRPKQIATR